MLIHVTGCSYNVTPPHTYNACRPVLYRHRTYRILRTAIQINNQMCILPIYLTYTHTTSIHRPCVPASTHIVYTQQLIAYTIQLIQTDIALYAYRNYSTLTIQHLTHRSYIHLQPSRTFYDSYKLTLYFIPIQN